MRRVSDDDDAVNGLKGDRRDLIGMHRDKNHSIKILGKLKTPGFQDEGSR